MKIFLSVVIVLLLSIGLYFAFTTDWSKVFNTSTLEKENKRLQEEIIDLEHKRDSLKPIIEKYEMQTDSLLKIDSSFQNQILVLKSENLILERKKQS